MKEVELIFDRVSFRSEINKDIRNEIILSVSRICMNPPGMTEHELATMILSEINLKIT